MCDAVWKTGLASYIAEKGSFNYVRTTAVSPISCTHARGDYTREGPSYGDLATPKLLAQFNYARRPTIASEGFPETSRYFYIVRNSQSGEECRYLREYDKSA